MAISTRTDGQIQGDVLEELKWDTRLHPNEIGVVVKNGVVTLTGRTNSYLKKRDAEEAAHRVSGVKAVANDIEVRLPGSAERTDADLAAAALNALKWDAAIPDGSVQVMVSKGWITLKGEVECGFQKRDAEHTVEHLICVRGVTNLIMIQPGVSPVDLKQKIEQALLRNEQMDARHITVETQGNKVILCGVVRSYAQKKAAEYTSWAALGVSEVDNRIVVSLIS
jgi:osmotically-inducible protein OsmY